MHTNAVAELPPAGNHTRLSIHYQQHPLQVIVQGDKVVAQRDEQETFGQIGHHEGEDAQREDCIKDLVQGRLVGLEKVVSGVRRLPIKLLLNVHMNIN